MNGKLNINIKVQLLSGCGEVEAKFHSNEGILNITCGGSRKEAEPLAPDLKGRLEENSRKVLNYLIPGWLTGDWDTKRSEWADENPQLRDSINAQQWTELEVYVYPTAPDDSMDEKYKGVFGFITSSDLISPTIVLRVVPGLEGRALPTLTHELGHYIRGLLRPDLYRRGDWLEQAFQEGLCEALVRHIHSRRDGIKRPLLHSKEKSNCSRIFKTTLKHHLNQKEVKKKLFGCLKKDSGNKIGDLSQLMRLITV